MAEKWTDDSVVEVTIAVPTVYTATLIGKRGSSVKQISAESKVEYLNFGDEFPPSRRFGDLQEAFIKGTPAQISVCIEKITEKMHNFNEIRRERGGDAIMKCAEGVELALVISERRTGMVIGRGGSRVKNIQSEAKVKLDVIEEPVVGEQKYILFSGTPAAVAKGMVMTIRGLPVADFEPKKRAHKSQARSSYEVDHGRGRGGRNPRGPPRGQRGDPRDRRDDRGRGGYDDRGRGGYDHYDRGYDRGHDRGGYDRGYDIRVRDRGYAPVRSERRARDDAPYSRAPPRASRTRESYSDPDRGYSSYPPSSGYGSSYDYSSSRPDYPSSGVSAYTRSSVARGGSEYPSASYAAPSRSRGRDYPPPQAPTASGYTSSSYPPADHYGRPATYY